MGKNFTIYVNNANFEQFKDEANPGVLVNQLLSAHYQNVGTTMASMSASGLNPEVTHSMSQLPNGDAKIKSTVKPTTCPNGHLLADGKCLTKGCIYGKRK